MAVQKLVLAISIAKNVLWRKIRSTGRLLLKGDARGLLTGFQNLAPALRSFYYHTLIPSFPILKKLPFKQALNTRVRPTLNVGQMNISDHRNLDLIVESLHQSKSAIPNVAVIIPCFNYGQYIAEAVNSVLDQSYANIDIYIIDDGSDDGTTANLIDACKADRVTIVHQKNTGLSLARNAGAKLASKADYLLFLDADDRLHKHAFSTLVWSLENDPKASYVYCDQHFFGDQELIWACQNYNAYDLLWSNHPTVTSLIRQTAFKDSGGYSAAMVHGYEDWAMWVQLLQTKHTGLRLAAPLFQHRKHGKTMTDTAHAKQDFLVRAIHENHSQLYHSASIASLKEEWRPAVSVIICYYNAHQFIDETLASLEKQTIKDFEIIIVNDGSENPVSVEKLADLTNDPKFKVININHAGLPSARNAGAKIARSDKLYFLDADDLIDPTTLEKLALTSALNPNASFVYSGTHHFGDIEATCIDEFDPKRLRRENFLTFSCLLNKSDYLELGGMDEALIDNYEDYDFWLRLISEGKSGVLVPESLFHYRRHGSSNRHQLAREKSEHQMLKELRERHPALYNLKSIAPEGPQKIEPKTDEFSRLKLEIEASAYGELSESIKVESYRRPNLPNMFSPSRWQGDTKHILYLLPYFVIGGAEQIDLNILAGLKENGWNITLVACQESDHPWLDRFREITDDIFFLPSFRISQDEECKILEYLCIARASDIVFNRNSFVGYNFARHLKTITRHVAVVDLMHLHNSGEDWVRYSAPFHEDMDRRFVITEDLKNHAVTHYKLSGDRFQVIYNGVDFSSEAPSEQPLLDLRNHFGFSENSKLIGFCGRMNEQKDPLKWLEVAAEVHEQSPDIRFVMLGDGELLEKVKQKIKALNLNGIVGLGGYQKSASLLLDQLDLLLLTSKYEGLPQVVLEAFAQNTKVLASDVGGTREAFENPDDQIIDVTATAKEYANATLFLLGKNISTKSSEATRRRTIEKFSLARQQLQYNENLENLRAGLDKNSRYKDYQIRLLKGSIL